MDIDISSNPMRDMINVYQQRGYVPIPLNQSCIGAEVLIHPGLGRVVKFGHDPAYDVFVRHALAAPCSAFPTFYLHALPAGTFSQFSNQPFTLTEMEVLQPLTGQEGEAITAWFNAVIQAMATKANPAAVPDPFQLTAALVDLRKVALNHGISLDLGKSSNYMARVCGGQRRLVITDPFN